MEKNFKLLKNESSEVLGRTVYRIECIKEFVNGENIIKVGDKGGYIENHENIKDNGWVYNNSCVVDNSCVQDNASIAGSVFLAGGAIVCGDCCISGKTIIVAAGGCNLIFSNGIKKYEYEK